MENSSQGGSKLPSLLDLHYVNAMTNYGGYLYQATGGGVDFEVRLNKINPSFNWEQSVGLTDWDWTLVYGCTSVKFGI